MYLKNWNINQILLCVLLTIIILNSCRQNPKNNHYYTTTESQDYLQHISVTDSYLHTIDGDSILLSKLCREKDLLIFRFIKSNCSPCNIRSLGYIKQAHLTIYSNRFVVISNVDNSRDFIILKNSLPEKIRIFNCFKSFIFIEEKPLMIGMFINFNIHELVVEQYFVPESRTNNDIQSFLNHYQK